MNAQEIVSGVNIFDIDNVYEFSMSEAHKLNNEYWSKASLTMTMSGVHASQDYKVSSDIQNIISKQLLQTAIIDYYNRRYSSVSLDSSDSLFNANLTRFISQFEIQQDFPTKPMNSLAKMFINPSIDTCYTKIYHHHYDNNLVIGINYNMINFDIRDIASTLPKQFCYELLLDKREELYRFVHQHARDLVSRRFNDFKQTLDQINSLISSSANPRDYYNEHNRLQEHFTHFYENLAHVDNLDRYVVPMLMFNNYNEAVKCVEWMDKIANHSLKRDDLNKFWLLQDYNLSLNRIITETMRIHWQ